MPLSPSAPWFRLELEPKDWQSDELWQADAQATRAILLRSLEETLRECGVRNFTIFVRGDVLFGYFEYVGDDYAADQAKMAADPLTQRWWSLTDPCQRGFDDDSPPNARWQEFDEVWHLV